MMLHIESRIDGISRISENGHDAIAHEFIDGTVMEFDGTRYPAQNSIKRINDGFAACVTFHIRGEADNVTEQYSNKTFFIGEFVFPQSDSLSGLFFNQLRHITSGNFVDSYFA